MTQPRRTVYLPLSELVASPHNPKAHDTDAIAASVERFGYIEPFVVDERTGYLLAGHGRRAALQAAQAAGSEPPPGVLARDGDWQVPVVVGWSSSDDLEATAATIALNRTTELGGWVDSDLLDLLDTLSASTTLAGTGFDGEDLTSLRARLAELDYGDERERELAEGSEAEPKTRGLPIDLILSLNHGPSFAEAMVGFRQGWQAGVMTSSVRAAELFYDRYPRAPRLAFMDNDWHGYDHEAHIAAVAAMKPKYATTRDLLTREQAEAAGVEWYSFERTMKMAQEVSEYVENVIVIPKYDCIDDIPDEYVLGYSVPSSYGGTPVPIERFRDRRVHLLGGPWRKQRAYLNVLGDDVVSLDNNHVLKISKYGLCCLPDGTETLVADVLGFYPQPSMYFLALSISLAAIATALTEQYGADLHITPYNDPSMDGDDTMPLDRDEAARDTMLAALGEDAR